MRMKMRTVGCILLLSACVHCGEYGEYPPTRQPRNPLTILFNGHDIRWHRRLLYHHELYRGYGPIRDEFGVGRLVCNGPEHLRPHWFFPTGEPVPSVKSEDFIQKKGVNYTATRPIYTARLSRVNSANRLDNKVNGLWRCHLKERSGRYRSAQLYHVGIYAVGLGVITNITCYPGGFSRTRSYGQIRCISKGGPPTRFRWFYNGRLVISNGRQVIRDFTSSASASGDNDNDYASSSYTGTLHIKNFHTGVYQYQVYNRAMPNYNYKTQTFHMQGDAPPGVRAAVVGSERIQVSWFAPSIPPGHGYEVTIDNQVSSAVRLPRTQFSYTFINVTPGVHSIQVKSLSQHYPGKVTEVRTVKVPGIDLKQPSSVSWFFPSDKKENYTLVLTRTTGLLQELCPNYQDIRTFTTTKMSLTINNLQEFSHYIATVSSTHPISIGFTTLRAAPTSAPGGFSHSVSSSTVRVTWKPIACIELNGPQIGYEVDFVLLNGTKTPIGEVIGETFLADGLTPGAHYRFKVAVLNEVGRGPFSSVLILKLDESAPGIVSNFTAEIGESTAEFTTVVISWSPPKEPNGAIIAYEVSYILNNQPPTIINITNVHYVILSLDVGTFISNISARPYTKIGPGPFASTEIPIERIMVTNIRVTLIPDTTSVRVEWDGVNSTRLAHYKVIYSSGDADEQSVIVPSSENFVEITELDGDKEYMFQVLGIGTINTVNTQSNATNFGASDSSLFIPCEDCQIRTFGIIAGIAVGIVIVGLVAAAMIVSCVLKLKPNESLSDGGSSCSTWEMNSEYDPNEDYYQEPVDDYLSINTS